MTLAKKFVTTEKGKIAYLEVGAADQPAVLLVHGIPTSSYLWRHVMELLGKDFRCLAPDLMGLGDTVVDPARTDFTMPSQAEMLDQFLHALGVARAHVVAHDQGGAAGQIFAVRFGKRLERLVLTDCVCYDNWPVPVIARLQQLARLPLLADVMNRSGLTEYVEAHTRLSRFRRGVARPDRMTAEAIHEYLRPLRGTRDERERFKQFLLAGSPRYTMDVVPGLRQLRVPTLVIWAAQDAYIDPSWGRRLFEDIPGAVRFELVPGAGHFWPEEAAEPFAARIRAFLTEAAPVRAAAPSDPAVVAAKRLSRRCPDNETRRS